MGYGGLVSSGLGIVFERGFCYGMRVGDHWSSIRVMPPSRIVGVIDHLHGGDLIAATRYTWLFLRAKNLMSIQEYKSRRL